MIPLKQLYVHKPLKKIYGDCHRTCIASILEKRLDQVPHFAYDWPSGEEFLRRINLWLRSQGCRQVNMAFDAEPEAVLNYMKRLNPDIYYILGAGTKCHTDHSVICYNDAIIHDPDINTVGVTKRGIDGYTWVHMIVRML